jgi:hypothetical protein
MLHNPKWDKVKLDPLDINTLILWLEKQPPGKRYCYRATLHCMFAQYFTAMGFEDVYVEGFSFHYRVPPDFVHRQVDLPHGWYHVAATGPYTFGAALQRARALAG